MSPLVRCFLAFVYRLSPRFLCSLESGKKRFSAAGYRAGSKGIGALSPRVSPPRSRSALLIQLRGVTPLAPLSSESPWEHCNSTPEGGSRPLSRMRFMTLWRSLGTYAEILRKFNSF